MLRLMKLHAPVVESNGVEGPNARRYLNPFDVGGVFALNRGSKQAAANEHVAFAVLLCTCFI
jgi:hypothetical protein